MYELADIFHIFPSTKRCVVYAYTKGLSTNEREYKSDIPLVLQGDVAPTDKSGLRTQPLVFRPGSPDPGGPVDSDKVSSADSAVAIN